MNQRIETPADTVPVAVSKLDALAYDIAARFMAIGRAVSESTELHYGDQASRLGELLDQAQHEYLRLNTLRDMAYEEAGK